MIPKLYAGAFIRNVMLWLSLICGTVAHAQSTTVYQDDFEGTVSGWTVNDTDSDSDVTTFLGRFADGQTTTSRSFNVPSGATELRIEFDLYRFDSWDNFADFGFDRFELDIDGTEIFSLPFPDPQGARSGTTGNVDWGHTNSSGSVELAFNTGQFFFDQIHRFVVTVNNPGATVNLTLRADLSQGEDDESAGFDNFLVTGNVDSNDILAVAETFADIDGSLGGVTSTVLASDTINGNTLNPNDVTITSTSSSSPNVTLNTSTGLITVAVNTPAGIYTIDYEICENINIANCSSVTETLTVFVPGGGTGGGLFCPAGTSAVPGTFNAASAESNFASQAVADLTVGAPVAEGPLSNNNVTANLFDGFIFTMNLTGSPSTVVAPELVPEGETVLVALAGFFGNNGRVDISTSIDGTTFTSLGTSGVGGSVHPAAFVSESIRYDAYVMPTGGARFLRVQQETGAVRLDGVIYETQCQIAAAPVTTVEASKTVAIFDPQGLGLYAIPGNDVIYTISVENTGSGDVDSDSLFLVDNMPDEVIFFNGDIDDGGPETEPVTFQDTGGGLTFDFNMDVGFSDAAAAPTDFASCTYVPTTGYDENVNFICLNPKGTLLAGSNLLIDFRAQIE